MATRNEGLASLATRTVTSAEPQPTLPLLCLMDTQSSEPNDTHVMFTYLNEGGANVVFNIQRWQHVGEKALGHAYFAEMSSDSSEAVPKHHREFTTKVLRVNKGLRKTLRCDEVVDGFYKDIRPLFMPGSISIIDSKPATHPHLGTPTITSMVLPDRDCSDFLMEHQLVTLFPKVMEDLISKSSVIQQEAGSMARTSKRRGILLPDMSSVHGSSITLEIKPKWLVQSPNAPVAALRCRTCALHSTKSRDPTYLCPLWLISGNGNILCSWLVPKILEKLSPSPDLPEGNMLADQAHMIAKHVAKFLIEGDGYSILQHIKMLQGNLDRQGVLNRGECQPQDIFDRNLRLAMTLRDCSMYIKVENISATGSPTGISPKIDCKLGDLDFKSADKIDDWESKERALIDGSAYTKDIPEDVCFLRSTS